MTEKLVQIQGNWGSVRVSGVVRVIGVRVTVFNCEQNDYYYYYLPENDCN